MGEIEKVEFHDCIDGETNATAVKCCLGGRAFASIQLMKVWVERLNNAVTMFNRQEKKDAADA